MNQEKIGQFISKQRKEKHLTQEKLGEILNVSGKSISRWETAKCMPDLSQLIPLSKALGVTVNDLMSGEILSKQNEEIKFQENIITELSKVQKKYKTITNFLKIYLTILLSIIFVVLITSIYDGIELKTKYQKDKMIITTTTNNLSLDTKYEGTLYYYSFEKNNTEYILITYKSTIKELLNKQNDFTYKNEIETNNEHIKVYYTQDNPLKIEKETIPKNAKLIYEK